MSNNQQMEVMSAMNNNTSLVSMSTGFHSNLYKNCITDC